MSTTNSQNQQETSRHPGKFDLDSQDQIDMIESHFTAPERTEYNQLSEEFIQLDDIVVSQIPPVTRQDSLFVDRPHIDPTPVERARDANMARSERLLRTAYSRLPASGICYDQQCPEHHLADQSQGNTIQGSAPSGPSNPTIRSNDGGTNHQ